MHFAKLTIKGSPFIGVFSVLTEKFMLLPYSLNERELKTIKENSSVDVIQLSLADSSLLGVVAKGKGYKILVSELVNEKEMKALEKEGIEALKLSKISALGNFLSVNDHYCVLSSKVFSQEQLKEIKDFLKVKLVDATINGSELIGSNMTLTNNGFIVNPSIKEKEFVLLEKELNLEGLTTTANYGDKFVGLSVVANSESVFVGERTSAKELMRIDEALSKKVI